MPGKICDIISGGRQGQIAFVDNRQNQKFLDIKKVHAYFFDKDNQPIVMDGKYLNGLIGVERLKVTGFYN